MAADSIAQGPLKKSEHIVDGNRRLTSMSYISLATVNEQSGESALKMGHDAPVYTVDCRGPRLALLRWGIDISGLLRLLSELKRTAKLRFETGVRTFRGALESLPCEGNVRYSDCTSSNDCSSQQVGEGEHERTRLVMQACPVPW